MKYEETIRKVAIEFSKRLHEELGDEVMKEVVARNKERGGNTCATHDFCDANAIMEASIKHVMGEVTDADGVDVTDEELEHFDPAWDMAYKNEFNVEAIEADDAGPVTLKKIIVLADRAYDADGLVLQYHENPEGEHGDGLAEFIARELKDTFDENVNDAEKIAGAIRALHRAQKQVLGVMNRLIDELTSEQQERLIGFLEE